ncbi:DUF6545 domain-containing protein [Streptomyces ipomoeae]|uniref:DUF6545 domain-containing protein n=1 Tax=Streptomyces ipomoeae TaxID=103232 RepID=UPI00114751C7|nr:DUF6545 domain-containing protein [Streptomyces ipomoeae]TQE40297.1 hypothetical protein Sipo7851_01160 [Streptomyces ipomoeae]
MSDCVFYLSGGLLLLACALKLPALIQAGGRDWLLTSICALLLGGGGVLLLAGEEAIITLRQVTGVTNLAAPLIYILLTAFSGASIVLVLHWRGGPDTAHTRRLSRVTIVAYGVVCALIAVLFVLGDTPVERRRDFDTYYATTPYIREMIVLYLAAHAVASLTASRLCWRWSHDVHGTLRVGLRVLAIGYLLHYGVYDPAVAGAVVARWAGLDWDFLIAVARGVTAPSAVLVAAGFIIPLAGHRGEDAVRYWLLAPLARAVRPVRGAANPLPVPLSWRSAMRLRLTQRQTYIGDRLVTCRPYFDARIQREARAAALARGVTGTEATAIADAAMIVTAIERQALAGGPDAPASTEPGPPPDPDARATFTSDLAGISRALRSPVVRELQSRTRADAHSGT